MVFQQNLLQKAYFIAKMSGPAGQFLPLESAPSKTKTVGSTALSIVRVQKS